MAPEPEKVKEKLTATMAPPAAALAAAKKDGPKRSEAENLLDGHAATLKSEGGASAEDQAREFARHGRNGGLAGFAFFGLASFWVLAHHGRWLHVVDGETERRVWKDAIHQLVQMPWFFETTTRATQLYAFGSLSLFFLACALVVPAGFGRAWMGFAGVLGWVNTRILLGIAYYLLITPVGFFRKLAGKDALRRERSEGSYWIAREKQRSYDHFERWF